MKFVSMLLMSIGAQVAFAGTFEIGFDRPGSDYRTFELGTPREILCQWNCQKDYPRCRAWTFVNPGVQGVKARCWLKNRVPPKVPNRNCTSGMEH